MTDNPHAQCEREAWVRNPHRTGELLRVNCMKSLGHGQVTRHPDRLPHEDPSEEIRWEYADEIRIPAVHTDDMIALLDSEEEGIEQGVLYLEGGQTTRTIRLTSARDAPQNRILITLPEVYEMAGRRDLSILHAKDLIPAVQDLVFKVTARLLGEAS